MLGWIASGKVHLIGGREPALLRVVAPRQLLIRPEALPFIAGSNPAGTVVVHAGSSLTRSLSASSPAAQATCARRTSELAFRVRPWLRIRTTSSGRHRSG